MPALFGGVVITGTACDRSTDKDLSAPLAAPKAESEPAPSAESEESTTTASARKPQGQPEPPGVAAAQYREGLKEGWTLGELFDVGPAGPATATSRGVVMVSTDHQLHVARLGRDDVLSPIELPAERFAVYGRGPAVVGDTAYFIAKNELRSQSLRRGGKGEVIAKNATEGTRVSALTINGGKDTAVGYISGQGERMGAQLWVSDGRQVSLTPEGAQGTSINLVPSNEELLALILEGRTSMAPVHARRVNLRGKRAMVSEDVVVWVGPPANPLTELSSLPATDGGAWLFMTLERSVTDFGMARLLIPQDPRMDLPVNWTLYKNGIDPAPVAAATACKQELVVFSSPTESRPRSPQELHLGSVTAGKLLDLGVVARSRAFNNVSLAATKAGALVAWTADRRTWARAFSCPR